MAKLTDSDNKIDDKNELSKEISKSLARSGINYRSEVVVGTSSTDFFVDIPSGGTAIFDIKFWEPSRENIERAKNLAFLNTTASGVNNAYLVLPGLSPSYPEIGVINPNDVITVINNTKENEPMPGKLEIRSIPKKKIFAAMPFAEIYDDTFVVGMQPATLEVNCECVRVDQIDFTGEIVSKIKETINDCVCVIADLSDNSPNVLYEMGYAEGIGLPVIQICSSPLEETSFDVRNNFTIQYNLGQTAKLKERLIPILKSLIVTPSE